VRGEELRFAGIGDLGALALTCSGDGRTLAVGSRDGFLGLCEVSTGQLVSQIAGPTAEASVLRFTPTDGYPGEVRAIALSASGLTVAGGTKSGRVLVRDVGALLLGKSAPERLSEKDFTALWDDLRGANASAGYRAAALITACPGDALPVVRKKLRPISRPDPGHVERLIARLDDPRFAERENAAVELERIIDLAEGPLRSRLAKEPTLEMRRRIERLLEPLDERVPPPDRLRAGRVLQALEHLGSPDARAFLEELSRGCPGAWLTEESRLTLARLRLAAP
jgi:hypothetical protein